jgi:hypothetical protein
MRRAVCRGALLVATLLGAATAFASARSELLVAQGEVAYHAGRLEDARARFSDALADDPSDDVARRWLDVLNARTPRPTGRLERPEAVAKPWALEVGSGIGYDSNVRLDPNHPKDDAAFTFTLAGHYDPWRDDRTLVRLDYDFYQSLHPDVSDFDFRTNRFRATVSRAVVPQLWLGLQGGYDHSTLAGHAYLQAPWVMPFASIVESDLGSTQFFYRHDEQDFLGSPFGHSRDGQVDAGGLNQLFFLLDRRVTLTLGYEFEKATPYRAAGDDFARQTNQGSAGVRFPLGWRTMAEVDYVYRNDDYTEPNSAVGFRKTRQDDGHYLTAVLRRPLLPHLDVLLSYLGTWNPSNIGLYDYRRHQVALELRLAY